MNRLPMIARWVGMAIRRPGDVLLAVRIGLFMWRTPGHLQRQNLIEFLDRIREQHRPALRDIASPVEHIARLRRAWFHLGLLRGHNTCYMRALTLYRFLPVREQDLQIHFVVEPARDGIDRLRGHAWVTLDDKIVEETDTAMILSRGQHLLSHPVSV